MVKVLLDLPMILNFLEGEKKAVEKVSIYLQRRDVELCLSTLTLADLYIVVKDPTLVEELEEHFTLLPFTDIAAQKTRFIYDILEEHRVPFSIRQVFLSAVCLANGAVLLTEDRGLYSLIPGLKIL